ncbi:PREDICTED: inhibitor of growth protein 3-like [Diuraphis noxia]|uniref:inhibitor of growth protein 3-like n=1 Tax=Diuraphis noxia TaxID=143948 RepID=UPI000763B8AF|nr:PREDICTED: inhibitor of growth protein 3-like [Diuraphis noxia]
MTMFYLEDFLEKLELLPQEMKNRTAEITKLDLQVENSMNYIRSNVDTLFSIADTMNSDDLKDNFKTIMKEGDKALELSDSKLQIAENMQKLLSKYINRLDLELQGFKTELEADKSGITELIEKKILDSDQSNTSNHKENDYETNKYIFGETEEVLNNVSSINQKSIEVASDASSSEELVSYFQPDTNPVNSQMAPFPLSFTMGADCSPISAVVSEAIVSSQKHRSASLIASFDAIDYDQITDKSEFLSKAYFNNKEMPEFIKSSNNQTNKKKKLRRGIICKEISTDEEESIDPNEPRYCLCNQVAYGTMVACDNKKCPIEWFHYECVGITRSPHGKWYCPKCVIKLKKKR